MTRFTRLFPIPNRGQLTMPHRVIPLVGGFNAHRQGFVLGRAFEPHIQTNARNAQHPRELAFVDRTARSRQRARQLHFVLFAQFPRSPRDFFSSSFCTVRSPIILLSSSGDSPGSYPWALARLLGS